MHFFTNSWNFQSCKKKDPFISSHGSSNVFLAARTTALARLKLIQALETVESFSDKGAMLLYCDTDSIILRVPKDPEVQQQMTEALQIQNFLGHLKHEKEEYHIKEFVSCKKFFT